MWNWKPELLSRSIQSPTMHYSSLFLAALASTCNAWSHHAVYTFENGIPDGLAVSNEGGPPGAAFATGNVRVSNGYLELLMPGGQTSKPYLGGQVYTREKRIKYGSVRTTAILTEPAGVCNGTYKPPETKLTVPSGWRSGMSNLPE